MAIGNLPEGAEPTSRRPMVVEAVWVTLLALAVYRLGTHVPLPGIDADATRQLLETSGLALERISIFALGMTPVLSALILFELARLLIPQVRRFEAAHPANAARMHARGRALALGFAAFQGFGIATALEASPRVVAEPGWPFRLSVMVTLVAATALLSWLADRITRRGLGNGFWLLLAVPSLLGLPQAVMVAWQLTRDGMISVPVLLLGPAWLAVSTVALVTLDRARHPLTGNRPLGGVWPPLLAYSVCGWIIALGFALVPRETDLRTVWFAPGQPAYFVLVAALITGFSVLRLVAQDRGQPGGEAPLAVAIRRRLGLNAGLVQAGICISGELLSEITPLVIRGIWLIVIVMLALRIADRFGIRPRIEEASP